MYIHFPAMFFHDCVRSTLFAKIVPFVPVCPKIHTLVNESKIWVNLIIIKSLIRCVNIGAYWGYDLHNIPENAWNFNSEDFQVCKSLKMSRIYNIKSIDWSYVISRFITFCSRLYCSSEASPIVGEGLPDLGLCSANEQGVWLFVSHILWHVTSVFVISF